MSKNAVGKKPTSASKGSSRPAAGRKEKAPAIPEAQHAAWYEVLRTYANVSRRVEQRLLEEGQIPLHWYDVLVVLEKAPEHRLRMSELAANALTSPSNLTRLVDRLAAKGLLRRETCPGDRRACFAVLTEAGAQARLDAWPAVSGSIVETFAAHVSDEEAGILTEVLRRVANSEPADSEKL